MKLNTLLDRLHRIFDKYGGDIDVDIVIERIEADGKQVQYESSVNEVAISRPNGNVKIAHMMD